MVTVVPNAFSTKLDKQDIPNVEFSYKDVASVPQAISGGFTEFKGEVTLPELPYDEIVLMLEGELEIKDATGGKVQIARKGDVFYFSKGAKLSLVAKSSAKWWYVIIRRTLRA